MTVVLELKPDLEAALKAKAEAENTSVETVLQSMIETMLRPVPQELSAPDEWIAAFEQWVAQPRRKLPVLSEEAMSRESIYGDEA